MLIKQNTRQAARITVRNLKAGGKLAEVVDHGKHLVGNARWSVSVVDVHNTKTPSKHKRLVKKVVVASNKGFDIRKVVTGTKAFDVFYDGEFLLRRDTKIEAYEAGLRLAHKVKLPVATLQYK